MFSFASKMFNTLIGTEDEQQQQQQQAPVQQNMQAQQFHGQMPGGPRMMGGGGGAPMMGGQPRPQGIMGGRGVPVMGGPRAAVGPMAGPRGPGGMGMPRGGMMGPRMNGPQGGGQIGGSPVRMIGPRPHMGSPGRVGPSMGLIGGVPPGSNFGDSPMMQQGQMRRDIQPQPIAAPGEDMPSVDLSHLSKEERAMIESVMAKAKEMDKPESTAAPNLQNQVMQGGTMNLQQQQQQFGMQQHQNLAQQQQQQQQQQMQEKHLMQNEQSQQQSSHLHNQQEQQRQIISTQQQFQQSQQQQQQQQPSLQASTMQEQSRSRTEMDQQQSQQQFRDTLHTRAPFLQDQRGRQSSWDETQRPNDSMRSLEDRLDREREYPQALVTGSSPLPGQDVAAEFPPVTFAPSVNTDVTVTTCSTASTSSSSSNFPTWRSSFASPSPPSSPKSLQRHELQHSLFSSSTVSSDTSKPYEDQEKEISKISNEIFEWQPKKMNLERKCMESTILEENNEKKEAPKNINSTTTITTTVPIAENADKQIQNENEIQSPPTTTVPSLPFLDHSPGEVYTIPEEEEEAASPTSGDGVTSLRRRGGASDDFHSNRNTYLEMSGRNASRDEAFISDASGMTSSQYRMSQSDLLSRNSPKTLMDYDRSRLRGMQKDNSIDGTKTGSPDTIVNPLLSDPMKMKGDFMQQRSQLEMMQMNKEIDQENIQKQINLLQLKQQMQKQDSLNQDLQLHDPSQQTGFNQKLTSGSNVFQMQSQPQGTMQHPNQTQLGMQSGMAGQTVQNTMQQLGNQQMLQQQQATLQGGMQSNLQSNMLANNQQSGIVSEMQQLLQHQQQTNTLQQQQQNMQQQQQQQASLMQSQFPQQVQYQQNTGLQQSTMQNPGMQQSNMQNTNMQQANMQNTGMQQSSMQNTGIQQSNIQNNMQQSNMQNTVMQQPNLQNTGMQQTNMQNMGMQQTTLQSQMQQQNDMQLQSQLQQQNALQQGQLQSNMQQQYPQQAHMQQANQYQTQQTNMQQSQMLPSTYSQQQGTYQQSMMQQGQPIGMQAQQRSMQLQSNGQVTKPSRLKLMELREGEAAFMNHVSSKQQQQGIGGLNDPQGAQQQNKSTTGTISGMLADFSRALGLGGTSPRPSPSEDKNMQLGGAPNQQQTGLSSYQQTDNQNQFNRLTQNQQPQMQQLRSTQYTQGNMSQVPSASTASALGQQLYQQNQAQLTYQEQQQQAASLLNMQGRALGTIFDGQHQMVTVPLSQAQQVTLTHDPQALRSTTSIQGMPVTLIQPSQTSSQQPAHIVLTSCQHLTPQQQQMYQQQMQLQHQAQHLKKIRRSLPHSSEQAQAQLQQVQQMRQKVVQRKDGILGQVTSHHSILSQPIMSSSLAGVTSSVVLQQADGTPFGTPQGTPVGTPRSTRDTGGDSSDTLSETDSQKSLRMRRKLPPTPLDPLESSRLTSTKKRERSKSQPLQDRFRSYSPLRHTLDASSRSGFTSSLTMARPSASETNLRSIAMGGVELENRPGSALGLLQVSSVVSSTGLRTTTTGMGTSDLTTTTSVLPSLYSSSRTSTSLADIASCLPPNLRHLLGPAGNLSSTSSLPSESKYSKQLPTYLQSLKDQLREEIKSATSDRRRLMSLTDKDARLRWEREKFVASMDPMKRFDMEKKLSSSMLSSHLRNRKLRGHRRQLSDPKIYPSISSIKKDGDLESKYERDYLGYLHPSLKPPHKSYELESLDDPVRMRTEWDPSQSYLASSYAAAGGALRETAINSVLDDEPDLWNHYLSSSRHGGLQRRSSEGEMGTYSWRPHNLEEVGLSSGSEGVSVGWHREHHRKHRKSRSWHPSPYVSDEDDDQLSREQKKQKIKVEIARRRQQIEENARLHEELLRLARLRESAELGFMPTPITEWYGYPSNYSSSLSPSTQEGTSVLKSIDEILRDEAGKRSSLDYGRLSSSDYGSNYYSLQGGGSLNYDYASYQSHSPLYRHHSLNRISGSIGMGSGGGHTGNRFGLTEEDRSMERIASTFRTDDYTTSVYERLSDFSPLATDSESVADFTPAAMPLLPDMPTRSRKLLEDLGSSPITESVLSLPQKGKPRYVDKTTSGNGRSGDSSRSCKPYPDNYGTLGGSSRKPIKSGGYSVRGGGTSGGVGGGSAGSGGSGSYSGGGGGGSTSEGSKQPKKAQASNIQHSETKYNFPVKRIFLTRDPEDRSVGGNGLGMKIIGGKEIPESNGQLGAFVAKIYPGGVVDIFGDINENDQILEWNGISLNDKTFEEVQNLLSQSKGDIELVVKSNCSSQDHSGDHTGGAANSPLLTSKTSPRRNFLPSSNIHVEDLELIGPSAPHSNSSSYDNLSSTTIDM